MTEPTNLTVFYDGSCPICAWEINYYRSRRGADAVGFVDISASDDQVIVPGLTKVDAMRRFTIMLPDGRISSGGVAFAHLWATLPGLRWLGRFFKMKPWPCILDGAYTMFLPIRPPLQKLAKRFLTPP